MAQSFQKSNNLIASILVDKSTSKTSMSSISKTSMAGISKTSISGMAYSYRGNSLVDGVNLGKSDSLLDMMGLNGNGTGDGLGKRGGEGLADGLLGVGAGLVNKGLVDGLVSPHGARDLLGSESGDVLEDWLSDVGGLDNGSGLEGGDGGGDVSVGGLGHGVSQGGDLGTDLSEGVGLSCGVGKVSTESVMFNRSTVMCWCSHQVSGCLTLVCDLGGGNAGSHEG